MNHRLVVQQQHERAVVQEFLSWINRRRRTQFRVVAEPIPPDAVIQSVRATSWVEVTDVFWTDGWARHLLSTVTSNETPKPLEPGPFVDMDNVFAQRFVHIVSNKLAKRGYLPYRNRYGPGYLVACVQSPFFNGDTLEDMNRHWAERPATVDNGCFRDIYVSYYTREGRAFLKWR
jgi:hypothetical protein